MESTAPITYKVCQSIEPIYSGGKISSISSNDGKSYLLMQIHDEIHARDIDTGFSISCINAV